jgi:hypothetical protein
MNKCNSNMNIALFVIGEQISSQWVLAWTEFLKNILQKQYNIHLKFKQLLMISGDDLNDIDKVVIVNTSSFFSIDEFEKLLESCKENSTVSSVQIGNSQNTIFAIKSDDDETFISKETLKFFVDEHKDDDDKCMTVAKTHMNFTVMPKSVAEYLVGVPGNNLGAVFSTLQSNEVTSFVNTSIVTPVETKIII